MSGVDLPEGMAFRLAVPGEAGAPELVVVGHAAHARAIGFGGAAGGSAEFRGHPNIRAWWPGRGISELLTRPLWRVTIDSSVRGQLTEEVRQILRAKQRPFGPDAVWMEL